MRAPVVFSLNRPVLAVAALALATVLGSAPVFADEAPEGALASPAVASELASEGKPADAGSAMLAGALSAGSLRVSAVVALGEDPEPVLGSFTADGLTYAVTGEGEAMLVAVAPDTLAGSLSAGHSGAEGSRGIGLGVPSSSPRSAAEQAPSGARPQPAPSAEASSSVGDGASAGGELEVLTIPECVDYDGASYAVTSIGPGALAGCDADVVALPASVSSVDELAFRGSSVEAVEVAPGSPHLSSYDGMLFSADKSSLLLIPEGKQGAARIPKEASSVPPDALSHCASVTSVEAEAGSAAFTSRNGCLYDSDGEVVLRASLADGSGAEDAVTVESAQTSRVYPFRISIDPGGLRFHRFHWNQTLDGGNGNWEYWDTWTTTFNATVISEAAPFKCSWAAGACWNISWYDGENSWMLRVDDNTPGYTFPSLLPYGTYLDDRVTYAGNIASKMDGLGNLYTLSFATGISPLYPVKDMPNSMGIRYASAFTVPSTIPKADGLEFLHWVVSIDGADIPISPGNQGMYNVIGDVTYTAAWRILEYSISYNLDHGTLTAFAPSRYTVNSLGMGLPTPTRVQSRFLGWYVAGNQGTSDPAYLNGTATWLHCPSPDFPTYTTCGNLTLTANWACLISFEDGAGEGEVRATGMPDKPIEVKTGESYAFPAAPSREGYRFVSWRLDKGEGFVLDYQPGQVVVHGDARGWTLVAQWERNDFSALGQGGQLLVVRLPLTEQGNPCEPSGNDWEQVGVFDSWRGEGFVTGAGGGVTSGKTEGTAIAYYAWVGGEKYLYEIHPQRSDHYAKGWEWGDGGRVEDGTKAALSPGAAYSALWRPRYAISLNLNGIGAFADAGHPGLIETGCGLDVDLPGVIAYGYRFAGWNAESDGSGSSYAPGLNEGLCLTDVPGATVALFAQWVLVTDVELPVSALADIGFELGVPDGSIRVAGTQAEAVGWLRSRMPVEVAVVGIDCKAADGTGTDGAATFWRDHVRFVDMTLRTTGSLSGLSVSGGQALAGSREDPLLTVPAAAGNEDGTLGELGELELLYGLSLDRLFADEAAGGAGVDIADLLPQGEGAPFAIPHGLVCLAFTVEVTP